ncbi:trypsin-like serine peptidase [Kitasatospora viridis]|uniref:V8-like Glu-specific endopeptidase n=1 Tax=Kitasatospora viridis TaxID=281105 RepID=A0A561UEV7_9ACTN|nr:serine protease [Kitasatospora viridis]TWF97919.1 V8-like Glu-specific endopeptidase [Kitasatospora viridis]
MISQRRRREPRRPAYRPAVALATLAVVLLGAVAGVSLFSSDAWAFTGLTSHRAAAKATRQAAPAPASQVPSSAPASSAAAAAAAGAAGQAVEPAPTSDSPQAQLPPVNTPSPSAPATSDSPTPTPTPDPSTPAPDPSTPDTRSAPTTAVAPAGPESNRVGALFSGSAGPGNHFCTASVVNSPGHNLILTAAHCVSSANGVTFVPAYRDGQTPYGTWQVTKIFTTNGWSQNGDVDQDFALLQVAPNNGKQIQDVVGGFDLGLNESFTATVRLYGYPDNTDEPILCSNATTQQSAYQRRIDCPSYPSGTSGGPWVSTATGRVIGVIGGYQQGGNTDDTSYSAYFDSTIGNLYQLAGSS